MRSLSVNDGFISGKKCGVYRAARRTSNVERRTRESAKGGFTMVEIALSLAIIGFGLAAVMGVLPTLMNTSRQAIESTEVALAAQDYVEEDYGANFTVADLALPSKTDPATDSVATNGFAANIAIAYSPATNAFGTNEFSGPLEFCVKGDPGQPLLKTIQITYSWPPGSAKPQTFTFITEVAATRDIPLP